MTLRAKVEAEEGSDLGDDREGGAFGSTKTGEEETKPDIK